MQVFSPLENATPVKALRYLPFASLSPGSGCCELGMGFFLLGRSFSPLSHILAPSWIFNGRFWGMMFRLNEIACSGDWFSCWQGPALGCPQEGWYSLSVVAYGMSAGAGSAANGSCATVCLEVLAWHLGASSSAKAFSANAATASAPKSYGKLHSLFKRYLKMCIIVIRFIKQTVYKTYFVS